MRHVVSAVMAVVLLMGSAYGYDLQSSERDLIEQSWPRVMQAIDRSDMDMVEFVKRIRDYFKATNLHETKIAYLQEYIRLAQVEDENRRLNAYGFLPDIEVTDDDDNIYVRTNGLPYNHEVDTGASCLDRNTDGYFDKPYAVKSFEFEYVFPKHPELGSRPYEIDKEIGLAVNGTLLYHAKNDRGSFAGISDVLDDCEGQPDKNNKYHYHSEFPCLGVEETELIGYAFDGHKIYGALESDESEPVNLDVCNGHKHDGDSEYHYHRIVGDHTASIIGCFRAQPVWSNLKQGEEPAVNDLCKPELND